MPGCGNHGCFIEKPKGQGTNGRCNCLRDLGKENEQAVKRKLTNADLLAELGQNKEVVMFGTPSAQYDATEPRYEVKIIGPERLVKRLLDAIHNAA